MSDIGLLSNQNGSPQTPSPSLRPSGFHALINDFSFQIKMGIIGITILVIFFNDLYSVGSQAIASDYYNYVLVIPFMMAYLVYRKRRLLAAIMPMKDDGGRGYLNLVLGICGLLSSLMVYIYGVYTTDPLSYHLLALEIFLAGSIILFFNRQTLRTLAIPILLINAALPAAVNYGLSFWYAVSDYSIYPAFVLLKFLGLNVSLPASFVAPSIHLSGPAGQFTFVVGVASSGIYSFVGFTLFALFVAYIATGPIWKKVVLFLLGYGLLIPINILREVILVTAANYWGIAAFNIFHFTSGIVLITIVTFVLLAIGDKFFHLDYFRPLKVKTSCPLCFTEFQSNSFCSNCGKFLKSLRSNFGRRDFVALEAVIIVFLVFFVSFAPTYANAKTIGTNVHQLASGGDTTDALKLTPNVTGYNVSYMGPNIQEQEAIDADAVLEYQYTGPNGSSFQEWVQIQTAPHDPETSIVNHLVNYGLTPWIVYNNTNLEIPVNGSITPVPGNFIAFLYPSPAETWAILWWNTESYVNLGSYFSYQTLQIWLIEMNFTATPGVITAVGSTLFPIAKTVASWWRIQLPYSVLQVTLKQSSLPLAGVVLLPAAVVAGNDSLKIAKVRKSNGQKITRIKSEDERQLLEVMHSLKASNRVVRGSLTDILDAYTNLTGKKLTLIEAEIAMTYLEHQGFVKRKVIDMAGEPVQIWQSLVSNADHDISIKEKLPNVVRS
jgi:exosortase/archaeosortase family protein